MRARKRWPRCTPSRQSEGAAAKYSKAVLPGQAQRMSCSMVPAGVVLRAICDIGLYKSRGRDNEEMHAHRARGGVPTA
eukprot:10757760-Heterocapsa_arctica.AAC.1